MGAYLSEPIIDKQSSDLEGKRVSCGASSMQGWRVTQEDAHNCELDFDTETSFFAVYDGHGGSEVAIYSSDNFPQFLKDCDTYKKGDFEEALKEAFLGFDAKLATPAVVSTLKEIAGNKEGDQNDESEDDEDNVRNLFEEAEMPLEQVMAKYQSDLNPNVKKLPPACGEKSSLMGSKRPGSSGASSSGISVISSVSSSSEEVSSSSSLIVSTSSVEGNDVREITFVSETTTTSKSTGLTGDVCKELNGTSEADSSIERNEQSTTISSNEEVKADSIKNDTTEGASVNKQEVNGDVGSGESASCEESKTEDLEMKTVPCENRNGEGDGVSYVGKGKGKAKILTPEETSAKAKHMMVLRENAAAALYKAILEAQDNIDSDSDSDDPGDETFEGAESSDDDGDENDAENDGEEEEEEDEEEEESGVDDEEDDEDPEDDDFTMKMTDEPGYDSGCTAVMALLQGRNLYVANAGDSRCIVCRSGLAIEMSLDHKPEDQLESTRIVKAGGKVTADGRVNGGLNLSRALGDHAYKLNAGLPAQEQMITALPDIRTLVIDPLVDEFMVLACDGIWNFMSSQEVCDFVRPRVQEGKLKLSAICEELFDHCLAPNTLGDGTGCDNMTAVIVKFHPSLAAIAELTSVKRSASNSPNHNEDHATKRAKPDDVLTV